MDKAAARQFRERWKAVQMIQQRESSLRSIELRWRKLNAIFSLGKVLQLTSSHTDEMCVYQRWAKLKEKLQRTPLI